MDASLSDTFNECCNFIDNKDKILQVHLKRVLNKVILYRGTIIYGVRIHKAAYFKQN